MCPARWLTVLPAIWLGGVGSDVADRGGVAAEAACVVEEMYSPSEIPANETKKEAVTAVIIDTGRGTKGKAVEWTSDVVRVAQKADIEIKPILE